MRWPKKIAAIDCARFEERLADAIAACLDLRPLFCRCRRTILRADRVTGRLFTECLDCGRESKGVRAHRPVRPANGKWQRPGMAGYPDVTAR